LVDGEIRGGGGGGGGGDDVLIAWPLQREITATKSVIPWISLVLDFQADD